MPYFISVLKNVLSSDIIYVFVDECIKIIKSFILRNHYEISKR